MLPLSGGPGRGAGGRRARLSGELQVAPSDTAPKPLAHKGVEGPRYLHLGKAALVVLGRLSRLRAMRPKYLSPVSHDPKGRSQQLLWGPKPLQPVSRLRARPGSLQPPLGRGQAGSGENSDPHQGELPEAPCLVAGRIKRA